ncbi:OmpA family protein [Pedobacter sp.]|uniref:OmpA family protein n=1 Tax=Pedobacter sp. TaxID=1411316 RepID=UPI003BA85D15
MGKYKASIRDLEAFFFYRLVFHGGRDKYHQWISQSRANSAVQYIIDNGIEKSLITAKGYGETKHVNKCSNGVICSEADHQLNRRTEFTITKQ